MKNEFKVIIQELKEVVKEENLKLTDYELLDIATRLYNTIEINKSKKPFYSGNGLAKKKEELENEKPVSDQLATKAQIWRIKKEGKTIPKGLTKKEASKIINELNKYG